MSMTNRLLYQQLKNIIRSLKEKELEQALKTYEQISKIEFSKTCKMISYKCYEASIICKSKKANGYGRNDQEATANCIKNVFEFLLEEDANITVIMQALKKDHNNSTNVSIPNELEGPNHTGPVPKVGINYRVPTKNGQFDNSIALNLSIHQNCDTSFDMKGDIEALSKNIGNISIINNSRQIDNHNTSHLEMDDILLKMMFDNAERTKNLKDYNTSAQITIQNLSSTGQYGNPFGPSFRKNEPLQSDSRVPEKKKILSENINLQNQEGQSYTTRAQSTSEATNSLANYSSRSKNYNKENIEQENRDSKGQNFQQPKNASYRAGSVETERQKSGYQTGSSAKSKCTCSAVEELAQAQIRIEYLENKLKIIQEENRMLKQSSIESKQKDSIYKSTDVITNASVQFNALSKIPSEKTELQSAVIFPSENADITYETTEKKHSDVAQLNVYKLNVAPFSEHESKQRSQSVEASSKRKTASSYTDVSGEQNSRPEVKRMIPRLRLDMLPSGSLKYQKKNTSSLTNLHLQTNTSINSAKSTSKPSSKPLATTTITLSQNSTAQLMSQVAHMLESGSQRQLKYK